MSNLQLLRGQIYVMYKQYNSMEMFQVITPNSAIKMKHNTLAMIGASEDGATAIQVGNGNAHVLFGTGEGRVQEKKVGQMEGALISKDSKFRPVTAAENDDFAQWNKAINDDFEKLHKGQNALPKPVQTLSPAVFEFAQKYGDMYGEWLWDDLYGYVWRPFYNQNYPGGTWQPYIYGNWTSVNDQLFWVPGEPWGWIPYHLGIWQWDKKLGWVWLPGSLFAPAWATWDFFMGFYTWRPWSLWDWYYYDNFWGDRLLGSLWSFSADGWYYNWVPGNNTFPPSGQSITKVRKDQLKKPTGQLPYPLPKQLKNVYKAVITALKKGDGRALDSLKNVPNQLVMAKGNNLKATRDPQAFIRADHLAKINESLAGKPWTVTSASFNASQRAAWELRSGSSRSAVLETLSRPQPSQKIAIAPRDLSPVSRFLLPTPAFRFRDWNPDVKEALRMGVEIRYSSRVNEIRCPQLGLSSANVSVHRYAGSAFAGGGFYGNGSLPSSSSNSSSGQHVSGARSEGSSGSSHSGSTTKKGN